VLGVRSGHEVSLVVRDPAVARALSERRENPRYLPGVALPPELTVAADPAATTEAELVVLAVPSEAFRAVCRQVRASGDRTGIVVSATKGLEVETRRRMSEVAEEELPRRPITVLSGPSFALEAARGHPTAVVVAGARPAAAETVQHALSGPAFRIYTSDDVAGVELAGALKNVIAIAAGIVDGLGYGPNTVAALVTRGLAEMTRLGVALGGRPETFAGLAGLGDLVLTATGDLSRNRSLGRALGQGCNLAEAVARTAMVAEGVRTTRAACELATRAGVEMPITQEMHAVLYGGKPPREAVDALMIRRLKRE
jgi:glycerol-3-phosphate dehydrogenase (NAD(P)+)